MILESAHDDGWLHMHWIAHKFSRHNAATEREVLEKMWAQLSPECKGTPCLKITEPMVLYGENNDVEVPMYMSISYDNAHPARL